MGSEKTTGSDKIFYIIGIIGALATAAVIIPISIDGIAEKSDNINSPFTEIIYSGILRDVQISTSFPNNIYTTVFFDNGLIFTINYKVPNLKIGNNYTITQNIYLDTFYIKEGIKNV